MAIVCPTCRAVYVDGTLFCDQCGNWLIGVAAQADETVPGAQRPGVEEVQSRPQRSGGTGPSSTITNAGLPQPEDDLDDLPWLKPVSGLQPLEAGKEPPGTLPLPRRGEMESGKLPMPGGSAPTRLRVLVLNTGRLTEWIDDQLIQVGRTDRSVNVFPQIDLEVDGGHNAGVSRRHVKIIRHPEGYVVEDLGSINGTFLNRRRLSPGGTAELRDGDELRVGNIVLRVQLGGYAPPG